jgi:selenide,water dikinase
LRRLPLIRDPNLLVGTATADDAGVYRIDRDRALVQTVDFFTPIVDDPFAYGQIAAANALSDVYAMGGRPLTALNLLGVPPDKVPIPVINAILRGGAAKIKEARCVLVGGQSMRSPEPFYGLAVTGLVSPRKLITNTDARPGDLLVLTKPLGTGIITTGIKRGITSSATVRKAVAVMRQLNEAGAVLAERGLIRAGTDVTGFGLLGHLGLLCRESGVGAEIHLDQIPVLCKEVWDLIAQDCIPGGSRQNLETANEITEWDGVTDAQKALVTDAQTSGGLLLCVAPKKWEAVQRVLQRCRAVCSAVVGRIARRGKPKIHVFP